MRAGFMRAPVTRAMGAGRDLFGQRKDGSEVPIEIGLNPLQTGEGAVVLASIIDITERRRAADRLLESLREKEVMLREIHHRVKNNLAVIGSLLYLQSTTTRDARTLAVLQDCRDRVRSMALVHERLYRSEDLASVDFGAYAEELARELVRNSGDADDRVRLRLDCSPLPLAIDHAVPCGMILNELITNALRHAFPDGRRGEVAVILRAGPDGGAELCVRDDGVGVASAAQDPAEGTLGLRLVRSLARQVDAEFTLSRRGPGTEARLTLEVGHGHDNRP
jgi:two-component sensor histidine kinase